MLKASVYLFQLGRGNIGDTILTEWQNNEYPVVNSLGLGADLDDITVFWRLKESTGMLSEFMQPI